MSQDKLKIGILFSLTGIISVTERGLYQACLLAIQQINDRGGINGKILIPIVEDIRSDPFIAAQKAEKLIVSDEVIAIIGLYTTGCRKKVIPVIEKHNVLLFYPTFYEGSEQHPNVVYCGSLPNQQLLDFVPWLIQNVGKSFYLLGSDHSNPRETNRYIRMFAEANEGVIHGEHYMQLGDKNFSKPLNDIRRIKPDIVFSTLTGEDGISFHQQYEKNGFNHPIASTLIAETEIEAMNKYSGIEHYSCFPYFSSIDNERNKKFVSEYQQAFGTDTVSSVMENTYNSVFLLAKALEKINTFSTESLRNALSGLSLEAPQGKIIYDNNSQHLWLNSRIGKANEFGRFDILWESVRPIEPFPYFEHPLPKQKFESNRNDRINNDSLKRKMKQHKPLITRLQKTLSAIPFSFGYFDESGMLLEIFNNNSSSEFPLKKLVTGDNCHNGPLAKSGIGLALQKRQNSYEVTQENDNTNTENWIIAGFPMIGNLGDRRGVLGVCIPDEAAESANLMLNSIANIINLSGKIEEMEDEHCKISGVLHGISEELTNGLIVIKDGKIQFQNQLAVELFKRKQDLVTSILTALNEEQEDTVRTIMREAEGEVYEIKISFKNSMHFIYFKPLTSPKKRLYLDKKEDLTTNMLVGSNEAFLHTAKLARTAAKTNANVLVLGESGTGKELFARAIHNESSRKNKPFVALNCASISKELINSELFGYVDGAFTGAKKGGTPGKFEIANGGTLFLDEIGDMPFEIQATLLRALQENEIVRVGGHKPIPVDVRIIAATNKELFQEIAFKGSFRSDLYYRLNVFTIELMPLRNRGEDIVELSRYYLTKLSAETGSIEKKLSIETLNILRKYNWPGNIRELNNVIERAFYLAENSPFISPEHLPKEIIQHTSSSKYNDQDFLVEVDTSISDIQTIKQEKNEKERQFYIEMLMKFDGNVSKTADYIGISRTTLYRKLKEYSIQTTKRIISPN
ncbi:MULTISPECIES: transporter substrate-binding protein [Bacillaceae]|uniref:Sigma-54 factor interaction domain-containing protein n=1 Tax=Domibacillus aminovorans TaxID=29332 RepID=A0A177KKW5_9BACI|nr:MULTISPECIES: transporter substrate-binding protein [Bacillaceae]OAH54012.1 hypothetical protein AWH48_09600 [Domibacillus aminovorans]